MGNVGPGILEGGLWGWSRPSSRIREHPPRIADEGGLGKVRLISLRGGDLEITVSLVEIRGGVIEITGAD
jgi:hypothetical protein